MKYLPLLFLSLLLQLAAAEPDSFNHSVSLDGVSYSVDFKRHSARGPNFSVEVQQADGSFSMHSSGEVRTYLGSITELPGAMASALRRSDGSIFYHVLFEDGAEWINNGTTSERSSTWDPKYPLNVVGDGGAGSSIYAAEVGVDLPYSQYSVDNDVAASLEMIEHSINTTNLIYLRDAGIIHRLGRVIIRADASKDPYAGMTTTNPLLSEISNQWSNTLPASTHDISLVATSATGGGLASVGVVGNPGYSSNGSSREGDFSIVWRHEAGHNWSLGHFDGGTPEGATINSGNSLSRMSGPEQLKVINHRDSRLAKLDHLGPWTFQIPPQASLDRAQFLPQSPPILLDVLANDHDANGDQISLLSVETVTRQGGSAEISEGSGPGGRDQVLYTPPSESISQVDHFTYRIVDSAGRQGLGNVITRVTSKESLVGYYTFDQPNPMQDSSSYSRDATMENGPQSSAGKYDEGIVFDGTDDRLLAPGWSEDSDEITITAWIKRDGSQRANAGLVFMRGGDTTTGLNLGSSNELRYHWDNSQWWFDSGLVVPNNVWTFVALRVKSDSATLFMLDGSDLKMSTNSATHAVEPFDAEISIGRDPNSSARSFKGSMDQIQIHRIALSDEKIRDLSQGLDPAANPTPSNWAESALPKQTLKFTPGEATLRHRIFLSQDYRDVCLHGPGDSSDQGLIEGNQWKTPLLQKGTYFWRVDSNDGTSTIKGAVQALTIIDEQLLAHWKLDEREGKVALDSSGNELHAQFRGGPDRMISNINGAVTLDGNDSLESENPSHPSSELTITAWVRRNGNQSSFSGILFSRGGTTTTGLGFGNANELRYHWSNDKWAFDSGLVVPDGIWTFVALIVSPDQAAIYMDDGTGMQSTTNVTSHSEEAFDHGFSLGRDPGQSSRHFVGDLDDMRVYCRALSLAEIEALNSACPDDFDKWLFSQNISSEEEDQDHDSLSATIEYGLGTDPKTANFGPTYQEDGSYLFNLPFFPPCDLRYELHSSRDLISWNTFAKKDGHEPWKIFEGSDSSVIQSDLPLDRILYKVTPLDMTQEAIFYRLVMQRK